MSVEGCTPKKRLSAARILCLVLVVLLAVSNILYWLLKMKVAPSLERPTDTGNHSWSKHYERQHAIGRSERFPTVEERVKLYMSNWYLPPCRNASIGKFAGKYTRSTIQTNDGNESWSWPILNISDPWESISNKSSMMIDSFVTPDRRIVLHRATIEDCARSKEEYDLQGKRFTESRVMKRWNMFSYCTEVVELMDQMDRMDRDEDGDPTPILALFGDEPWLSNSFEIPFIAKHRAASTKDYLSQVTGSNFSEESCWKEARPPLKTAYHQNIYSNKLSPILWRLNPQRHWNVLPLALRSDRPWEQKKNAAFYSGDMTGLRKGSTDLEKCLANQRCRFVLEHADSKLIDAQIAVHLGILKNNTVNGTKIVKGKVGIDFIQQYKVIICFEGNDVSSGLKWMLQSHSVVLMPPPTRTSWAMEELLEPWIHYIPMFPNGSNAEEMVQWVLDNDTEARRIAERATLFMYDMVYHPQAAIDDSKIKEEIARRYRALWH
jgi:hypothetical protein